MSARKPATVNQIGHVSMTEKYSASWLQLDFNDGRPRGPFAQRGHPPVKSGIRLTSRFLSEDYSTVMANHYSALKRARQTESKTTQNRANKSRLRSALRSLREAIEKGDKAEAQKAYSATVSVVDKGVQKGVLHKNTASRYKARLSKRVKAVAAK